MRAFVFAVAVAAGLAALPAAAQSPTIGEALACETAPDPGLCLFRSAGANWSGGDSFPYAVTTALIQLGLEDQFGEDEHGIIAETRAMAEAARREAAGERPERVLTPLQRLSERERAYRWFVSTPDTFAYPDKVWRYRARSPEVIRLALLRWAAAASDDRTRSVVATMYAAHGFETEARALNARLAPEEVMSAFWIEVGDFAAAERVTLAERDPPNPVALLIVAAEAAEAGDNATATRIAVEVLNSWVREHSAEIVVVYDSVAIAQMAGSVLDAAGERARASQYANDLMALHQPGDELYEAHVQYALGILRSAGDVEGVCRLARELAQHSDVVRPREVVVELALCGDADAARVVAARYSVEDFWLAYALGEPLGLDDPPYVGGMIDAIEKDAARGDYARAGEMLHILFVRHPSLAASTINRLRADHPQLLATWRSGGAFAALRARLLAQEGTAEAQMRYRDRDAVFAAAFTLVDAP